MRTTGIVVILTACAAPLVAQVAGRPAAPAGPRPAPVILPVAQQIAAAVQPLPAPMQGSAAVLGYGADGQLVELRRGSGSMICLADDPKDDGFHVACYSATMDPFMARGRELRARGADQNTVDSVRGAESRDGRIRMPSTAMLYSLTGPAGSYNAATNTVTGARPLFVVYTPFATAESLGVTTMPQRGVPWMMHPGAPNAHIMFVPGM
jgi:hypothetical protein